MTSTRSITRPVKGHARTGGILRGAALPAALFVFLTCGACDNKARLAEEGERYWTQERYGEALSAFRRLLDAPGLHDNVTAYARMMCGRILTKLDRYAEATVELDRALSMYRTLGEAAGEAQCLREIGRIQEKQGNYRDAVSILRKARDKDTAAGDLGGAAEDAILMANVYLFIGDLRRAERYYRFARDEAAASSDRRLLGHSLMGLGGTYLNMGLGSQAIDLLKQALEIYKEIAYRLGESKALHNLGLAYEMCAASHPNRGEPFDDMPAPSDSFQTALAYYSRSLEIKRAIGDRDGEGLSLIYLGGVQRKLGSLDKAGASIREGMEIHRKILFPRGEALALLGLGEVDLEQGRAQSAADHFAGVERMSRTMDFPELLWKAFERQGAALELAGRPDEALEQYYRAMDVVEDMRYRLRLREHRSAFVESKMAAYHGIIRLLLEKGSPEDVFKYIEKAKSRALLDILGSRIDMYTTDDARLRNELGTMEASLRRLRQKIDVEMKRLPERQSPTLPEWRREARKLGGARQRLLMEVEAANIKRATLERPSLEAPDVQRRLEQGQALIEYFLLDNRIVVILLTGESLLMEVVDCPARLLRERLENIRRATNPTGATPETAIRDESEARALYDLLIAPIDQGLRAREVERLCIVPHGVLHHFPFQMLRGPDGLLAETYPLSYAPSASIYAFLADRPEAPPLRAANMLIVRSVEADLAATVRAEQAAIQSLGYRLTVLEKESAVKDLCKDADIIHFSVHGVLDPASPMFSNMRLAEGDDDDGLLEAYEAFDLDLRSPLVVLSACESGVGRISGGDEPIGLVEAFLFAGSRSVVSTLWKVDAAGAAAFMGRFYDHLMRRPPAEALREAQLDLMLGRAGVGPEYAHPFYWAPFIHTGPCG